MSRNASGIATFGLAGLTPVALTLLLSAFMLLPLGSSVAGYAMPHLAMISCFYWLSSRPMLIPYGACAIIGILLDLWIGVPLGINMAMLLLLRLFVLNQLKHYRGRNRGIHWIVFSVMAFGLFLMSWLLMSVISGTFLDPYTVFFQWLITSFFYAPVAYLLGRVRRWVL
ncbi:rod shape-determining protein MreD [Kordiimonas aquimaris]|uniref:rod shape-determining protein MreD n=1 Tax=Kordiimonas aquimaris TaxID=707591 RepID=UPI0021D3A123|nr:rod shape-determining protein MreD [Kordiimonas aquimaris]